MMWPFGKARKVIEEAIVGYSDGFRDAHDGIPPQHTDTQYTMGYRDYMSQWHEEE